MSQLSILESVIVIGHGTMNCQTEDEVLYSDGFKRVLERFLDYLKSNNDNLYDVLVSALGEYEMAIKISELFVRLSFHSMNEMSKQDYYSMLETNRNDFVDFVERFYNFWRRFNRFASFKRNSDSSKANAETLIQEMDDFANLILKLYRGILGKLDLYSNNVYRQLSSGINVGISLDYEHRFIQKYDEMFSDIPFIDTVVMRSPMITYPTKTTRSGMFEELPLNPLLGLKLDSSEWYCYPAKIGEYLAFIYFHQHYMVHGTSLANLFQLATKEEYRLMKPDMIYLFGVKDSHYKEKLGYYFDQPNRLLIGYASHQPKIDYFGYMKKMLLTLYNLKQMKVGNLPIHGAMVHVVLKNNSTANIIIVGDSGAGKSESLDAFRTLAKDYLKSFKIIFDDMGCLKVKHGRIIATGTEIGAFVRLDDMEEGYAFTAMDRAIFMNPDKTNSRMVMPMTKYQDVIYGFEVDYFLYANNYESPEAKIRFFDQLTDAQEVFISGKRMAKGTTSESGIVQSFFANPFGPAQNESYVRILIKEFFSLMFDQGVKVGEIYTQLGVKGSEKSGPIDSAKELFSLINS